LTSDRDRQILRIRYRACESVPWPQTAPVLNAVRTIVLEAEVDDPEKPKATEAAAVAATACDA
jgi:hypothetical protein